MIATTSGSTVHIGSATSSDSVFGELSEISVVSGLLTASKSSGSTKPSEERLKSIDKAVYAHLRAMRTLGRTSANTSQIAKALSLPASEVERAVGRLKSRGVKVSGA